MTDPPNRIGDKFETTGLVKLLCGLDQPKVSLVDEVGEAETLVLILFCYGYDETEIGTNEFVKGSLVSLVNALGELDLFFDRD